MASQIQGVVEAFFKHLSERNLAQLTELFAEDVDWYVPGDASRAPWLGKRNRKDEVADFYQLLWENTEPLSVSVEAMLMEGDTAMIAGEFSSRMLQTDRVVHSLFFIRITIQDGRIVKYRLLEDSLAVAQSLSE